MDNSNAQDLSRESYSQEFSIEEQSIEQVLSRIENSDNPTLELSILLENSQQLGAKIQSKVASNSKNQTSGKYSLTDRLNSYHSVKDKVLNSKLSDDQKMVLLYVYGDKQSSQTMTDYYKNQNQSTGIQAASPTINNNTGLTL